MHALADQSPDQDVVALLAATAQGDKASFEKLFRHYYRRVGSFVQRMVSQPMAVEEIINDTMMAIWKSAANYQGKSKVDTWVFGIAYNKTMEHIRRHQRHQQNETTLDDIENQLPADSKPSDLRQWVEKALQRLSPEHRAVIEWTYTFGYSYPEIAKIMECPTGTVKTRMFHAKKLLKPVLERLADPNRLEAVS